MKTPAPRCAHPALKRLVLALMGAALLSVPLSVSGNPVGPVVQHGQASFARPDANSLVVTNSPGAIIQWQGFSIAQGELTKFVQSSAQSAVLNRVVAQNPSLILGQLSSNGRVFLINPAGIAVGAGGVVDTAGFVASTLNLTDADFLAGRLKFEGGPGGGAITNAGEIVARGGGSIYLVGPKVENSGLIRAEGGTVVLAAGSKLEIASLDSPSVRFEVQAPEDSAVNLGRIEAAGGAVGVFAGTLRHSGAIRADTVKVDETGTVILAASKDIVLEPGSLVSASGAPGGAHDGGTVRIVAEGALDLQGGSEVHVDGGPDGGHGGFLELSGKGTIALNGLYTGRAQQPGYRNGSLLIDPANIEIVGDVATFPAGGLEFSDHQSAVSPDGAWFFISNRADNTVTVIEAATGGVFGRISVGAAPGAIAFRPDGSQAYVANQGDGTVSVIETSFGSGFGLVLNTIPVGQSPAYIAVNADGSRVYVASQGATDSVAVIDTGSGSVVGNIGVGNDPNHLAFGPGGTRLYVSNGAANSLSVIDTGTNTVLATVSNISTTGGGPSMAVASPDGSRVYVSVGWPGNEVAVVNTASWTVASRVTVGTGPYFMALAGTDRLYVANLFGGPGQVSVIDTTTDTIDTQINFAGGFNRLAANAAGTRVFVASEGVNTLYEIDPATNSVVGATPAGSAPMLPVPDPSSGRMFVASWRSDSVTITGFTPGGSLTGGVVAAGDPPAGTLSLAPSGLSGTWGSVSLAAQNDIRILSPILDGDVASGGSLTLTAGRNLDVNAPVGSASSPFDHALTLEAGNVLSLNDTLYLAGQPAVLRATAAGGIGTVRLNAGIVKAGGADTSLAVAAAHNIVLAADSSIVSASGRLNVSLTSDADGFGDGNIVLYDGSRIETNGGSITLGGGIGPGNPGGHASGSGPAPDANGIFMNRVTVRSGGGDITLRGRGFDGLNDGNGIAIYGDGGPTEIDSAGGAITLDGISGNGPLASVGLIVRDGQIRSGSGPIDITGVSNGSVWAGIGAYIERSTVAAAGNSVTITGTGGPSGDQAYGVLIEGSTLSVDSFGDLDITGTGRGSGASASGVVIRNAGGFVSSIGSSNAGDVTITGTAGPGTGNNQGVVIGGAGTQVTMTGGNAITVTGNGNAGGTGSANHGVIVANGAAITGDGAIGLAGTGGGGDDHNRGVDITDSGTLVRSTGGPVALGGTGGGSFGGHFNHGVQVRDGAEVSGTGSVTLTGHGGDGINWTTGVVVSGAGTLVGSSGGLISIDGDSPAATGAGNTGVSVESGGAVRATGTAIVSITGSGTPGAGFDNHGVIVYNGGKVSAADGDVTVTGFGGGTDASHGVLISDSGSDVVSTGTGAIRLTGTGGGTGSGSQNKGVSIGGGAHVSSEGTGFLQIGGGGGAGIQFNHGVGIYDAATRVTSAGGGIEIAGTGGGSPAGTENHGVDLGSARIEASGGGIVLDGTGGTGTDRNMGIFMWGGAVADSASGNVSLSGQGGGSVGDNAGVVIVNAGTAISGAAGVTVTGTGGDGSGAWNRGVRIGDGAAVSSPSAVSVAGTGGDSAGGFAYGVDIGGGGRVFSTGAGTLTVTGTGGGIGQSNRGVAVYGVGTRLEVAGGDLTLVGTAGGNGTADGNQGVFLVQQAQIHSSGAGDIFIQANGGDGTDNNPGLQMSDAGTRIRSAGTGEIRIVGSSASSGSGNEGIELWGGAVIESAGTGAISVQGVGASGTGDNPGVRLADAGTALVSTTGAVSIDGQGGFGSGDNNYGVHLLGGAQVRSLGNAAVNISGTGGTGRDGNWGIALANSGTSITAVNGSVGLTGTSLGGRGHNYGIGLVGGARIASTGTGTLTLNGTGANGTDANVGVFMNGSAVETVGGALAVSGRGGVAATNVDNYGIHMVGGAAVRSTGSGTVTLTGVGGSGTHNNRGMDLRDSGTLVTSVDAAITMTGSSLGAGAFNHGVSLSAGADIFSTGSASIDIKGTGGPGIQDNYGVQVTGAGTTIVSAAGPVDVTGTGGAGIAPRSIEFADGGLLHANGTVSLAGTAGSGPVRIAGGGTAGSQTGVLAGSLALSADALTMLGGTAANAQASLTANTGALDVTVDGDVIVQAGTGSGATAVAFGQTQNIRSTAGNVEVIGMPGAGAQLLGGSGNQTVSAAGRIHVLADTNGYATISTGAPGSVQTLTADSMLLEQVGGNTTTNVGVHGGIQHVTVTDGLVLRNTPGATATSDVTLSATGGQTVNAGWIELEASLGSANIGSVGGAQVIDAGWIRLANDRGDARIAANNGTQTITTTGQDADGYGIDLRALGPGRAAIDCWPACSGQTIDSSASILLQGSPVPGGSVAISGERQDIATAGDFRIYGGTGATGNGSGAWVYNGAGDQRIAVAGQLHLKGGPEYGYALLTSGSAGTQLIEAGSILAQTYGPNGTTNEGIMAAVQDIRVTGAIVLENHAPAWGTDVELYASQGQSIAADHIDLRSFGPAGTVFWNQGGAQAITTTGSNAAGEGIRIGSNSGISCSSGCTAQDVTVANADYLRIVSEGTGSRAGLYSEAAQSITMSGPGLNTLELLSTLPGGDSYLQGATQSLAVDAFNLTTGSFTLSGPSTLSSLNWTGGTIRGTGALTIPAGGSFSIGGSAAKTLEGVTLVNETASGVIGGTGQVTLAGARLENHGSLTLASDAPLVGTGTGSALLSDSALVKSAGDNTSVAGFEFVDLSGTVDVQAGSLRIFSPTRLHDVTIVNQTGILALNGGGSHSGTIDVVGYAQELYSGGTHVLASGTTLLGEQRLTAGGILSVPAGTTSQLAGLLHFAGGTLDVRGTLDVTGRFEFHAVNRPVEGGGTGVLNLLPGSANLAGGGGFKAFNAITVNNQSGFFLSMAPGSTVELNDGAVWNNLPGSSFGLPGDVFVTAARGSATFTNAGTVLQSGGPASVGGLTSGGGALTFNNGGVVRAAGGTLVLNAAGTHSGTLTADAGAMISLTGGAPLLKSGTVLGGAGMVRFAGAVAVIPGGYTVFVEPAATVEVAAGSLTVQGGASLEFSAGTLLLRGGGLLAGGGTVNASVSNESGVVSPGASPGILTILGDYVQGPAGILQVELGGSVPGEYDQLVVGGTATLGGTLQVTMFSGFTGAPGMEFEPVRYAGEAGDFATVTVPAGFSFTFGDHGIHYGLDIAGIPPVFPPAIPTLPAEVASAIVMPQVLELQSGFEEFALDPWLAGDLLWGYWEEEAVEGIEAETGELTPLPAEARRRGTTCF